MNTKDSPKFQSISTRFARQISANFCKFLSISIFFYLLSLPNVFSAQLTVPDSLIAKRTLYLVPQASAPSSPQAGRIYYDDSENAVKYWDGSRWVSLSGEEDRSVATVIVAASDSLDTYDDAGTKKNDKADLTCQGANDEVTIQQAIDSLGSSGGAVYLLEGTYNLSDTVNISKDNVSLIGQGRGTVLSMSTSGHDPGVRILKDRVLISQIKIEKAGLFHAISSWMKAGLGADYCVIKNLWLETNNDCWIAINIDSHNIISQVHFYDPGPFYFRALTVASDNIISNNILRGAVSLGENNILSANLLSKEGVNVGGKNIILGNIIKEAGGVMIGGGYNNIAANLIYNCPDNWGIQSGGSLCEADLVSSNLLYDNGGGMLIFWTNNSLFTGNMFYNNNKYTFKKEIYQLCGSYNNLYSFNYIYDSDASVYGIYIDWGSSDPWENKGHYLAGNFIDTAGGDNYKIYDESGAGSALDITYTQKEKITIERQIVTLSSSPATLEAAVTPRGYVVFDTGGNNYDLGTSDGSVNAINNGKAVGDTLILEGPSSGSVAVKNGANVLLNGGTTLSAEDTLTLIWNGADWMEIAHSNN